jgi:hypothetical protein
MGTGYYLKIKHCKFLTLSASFGIQVCMKSIDEQILRTSKEIIVKFIELGRLSPASVHESFRDIYATVNETVKKNINKESPSDDTQP